MNTITPKTDLEEYLPDWYKPILDYQEILAGEIPQFENAATLLDNVHKNLFLDEMGTTGVAEWEKIFSITPASTDTLDDRRDRIKRTLWTHPPFTEVYIRERLDEIIGTGEYTLTVDRPNYRLILASVRVGQTFTDEPIRFLNRTKPAHIVLDVVYMFNKWNDLSPYTWNQMHSYTWTQAREDGSL